MLNQLTNEEPDTFVTLTEIVCILLESCEGGVIWIIVNLATWHTCLRSVSGSLRSISGMRSSSLNVLFYDTSTLR